ncbi:MAG: class I SAM-dependent methyltransferase [Planctomycetota bacterium]
MEDSLPCRHGHSQALLEAMMSEVTCPLCDSPTHDKLFTEDSIRIVSCHCGMMYSTPQASQGDLEAHYDENYEGNSVAIYARTREAAFRHYVNRLQRFGASGRHLDVGSSFGFLMDTMGKAGFDTEGVEISKPAIRHAREVLGRKVTEGVFTSARFPDNTFDAITMTDIVEHLARPRVELREAWRVLRPGGLLLVAVPNMPFQRFKMKVADVWETLLGRRPSWGTVIPRIHINHFTRHSLRRMLEDERFEVLMIEPGPVNRQKPRGSWHVLMDLTKRSLYAVTRWVHSLSGRCIGQELLAVARKPR